MPLLGKGSPTRGFLYVEDAAAGIVLASERDDGDLPVNFGRGEEVSVPHLAETVAALTGFEGEIAWDTSQPNGQPRLMLDVSRAEKEFEFRALTAFDAGLTQTVHWFLENGQSRDFRG